MLKLTFLPFGGISECSSVNARSGKNTTSACILLDKGRFHGSFWNCYCHVDWLPVDVSMLEGVHQVKAHMIALETKSRAIC